MNIHNVYAGRYQVPAWSEVFSHRKPQLSSLELLGLEAVLVAFIQQYEEESCGEILSENFTVFTRYNADNVDILDGCYDTYIFDVYAIDCIYATENGIPVLSCYKLEHPEYDDPFEVVEHVDWMSECEQVLFRLD